MVEWQDIKIPWFIAIGFLFIATSLILFMLGKNENAAFIALVLDY